MRFILLLLCTIYISHNAMGAGKPLLGSGDAVYFYFPQNDSAFVEIYWQLNNNSVRFNLLDNNKVRAFFNTHIYIKKEGKTIVADHYNSASDEIHPSQTAALEIFDLRRYALAAGIYDLEVTVMQGADSSEAFRLAKKIHIPYIPLAPRFSDMQLLDTVIYNIGIENVFAKNNNLQIPAPTNFVDDKDSVMIYYELSHIQSLKDSLYPLFHQLLVSKDSGGGAVYRVEYWDTIVAKTDVIPYLRPVDIRALPSGNYYFVANILDKDLNLEASHSRFFQVYNPDPAQVNDTMQQVDINSKVNVLNLDQTFVAKYNLTQIKAILTMLLPLSTANEARVINGFLKRPNETYMRYYIYNHFLAVNPGSPAKAWDEFSGKIAEINKLFGRGSKTGYETDRGRVYLRYGPPNDRVIVNSEAGALPYEIWQYYAVGPQNQEGVFLFYQPPGSIGDYMLIHSTINGELKNPNWMGYLYVTGQPGNNSKADQLIRNR